jgi:hypothetical protein
MCPQMPGREGHASLYCPKLESRRCLSSSKASVDN